MNIRQPFVMAVFLLMAMKAFGAEAMSPHYHIAQRIAVAGDTGWDLLTLDESSGRVYLSHGTSLQAVDTATGKTVGSINNLSGVHGVALATAQKKGFVTSGKDKRITVFSLDTLKVEASISATGEGPDAIIFEPLTQRIFAFNAEGHNVTVIDASSNAIIATVALDGQPELPAVDEKGTVFVNLEDQNSVDVVDGKTLKLVAKWALPSCEAPTGLAIDVVTHRLFAACHNKIMVVLDSVNGQVVATLPIGERVDGAVFDSQLRRAYSSNGDGTLTVIQEINKDRFAVVDNVTTQKGARTIALNSRTHHLYLPTAEYGEVPAPTTENPHPRAPIKSGTFVLLDIEPVN